MELNGVLYACGRAAMTGRLVATAGGCRFEEAPIDGVEYLAVPGLVNAHDHLHLNAFPRTRYRDRYDHSVDWVRDMALGLDAGAFDVWRGIPEDLRAWHGAAKNVLCGATIVVHHDPRLAVFDDPDFPVTVPADTGWAHSVPLGDPEWRDATGPAPRYGPTPGASAAATPPGRPWFVHVAEGTDSRAAAELPLLETAGALSGDTRLVHGVGLTAHGVSAARAVGAALVWCPSSNEYLLGSQPNAAAFAPGRLALGTDSRLTGSRDLLSELQAATSTGLVSPVDLLDAVTAAGRDLVGAPAAEAAQLTDLAVYRVHWRNDDANVAQAALHLTATSRADLVLVVSRGRTVLSTEPLEPLFTDAPTPVHLDGEPKLIAGHVLGPWMGALHEPGLEILQ